MKRREEGISRKRKGQTEEKNSQKVGERSWGKEERRRAVRCDSLVCLRFLRKYLIGLSHTCSSPGQVSKCS